MKTTIFQRCATVVCGAFLSLGGVVTTNAQETTKPRVSVTFEQHRASKGGSGAVAADSVSRLLLNERSVSLTRIDSAFHTGDAIIKVDFPPMALLVVPYAVLYRDAQGTLLANDSESKVTLPAPLPAGTFFPTIGSDITRQTLSINTLQGDLQPRTRDNNNNIVAVNTTTSAPNTVNFQPGEREKRISFAARWSDQSWEPRSAGLQGQRTVTVILLPDATGTDYNLGTTIATVTLDDPKKVAPVLLNAIQDRLVEAGRTENSELETPGFRSDGKPNTVFFDENYNLLTYTAVSSDPNVATVQVLQNDPRFNGRPSFTYIVNRNAPVGATAKITITANDGFGGTGFDDFVIRISSGATSVPVPPEEVQFSVYPNPVVEQLTIQARAQQTGIARIRVGSALGMNVFEVSHRVVSGEVYRQSVDLTSLPSGVYFVEINDGAVHSVQKIVKN